MSEKVALGGKRLGSGKKNSVELHGFERSSHDVGYTWRSTMSAGTLVPFFSEVATGGTTMYFNLDADVKTMPTVGPLFGSYKMQLDVFSVPIRLFNSGLHMNKLGIGMKMSEVKFPNLKVSGKKPLTVRDVEAGQINSSCVLSYLGMRGLGTKPTSVSDSRVTRDFNGLSYLSYASIFKDYYANKQEKQAFVIHNDLLGPADDIVDPIVAQDATNFYNVPKNGDATAVWLDYFTFNMQINHTTPSQDIDWTRLILDITFEVIDGLNNPTFRQPMVASELFSTFNRTSTTRFILSGASEKFQWPYGVISRVQVHSYNWDSAVRESGDTEVRLTAFDLENIDACQTAILAKPYNVAFEIGTDYNQPPYSLLKHSNGDLFSINSNQEGLFVKTYQSDLFNNWVSTEWIDGDQGINKLSAIPVQQDNTILIDDLMLGKKIYQMLMRIGVSGGTYDDWQRAVYDHEAFGKPESAEYHGGLIKEVAFQEVVSNAQADGSQGDQPLGSLAGRGKLTSKHKGGEVKVKVHEASYIIGIVSLTPRVDYSQGNKWDCNLKTMDDLHKPSLDQIGFQNLITDQMHWGDTQMDEDNNLTFFSAGKVPAWINYMTNVNQVRGNFANGYSQDYMVLDRRYEIEERTGNYRIKDLTTYIDPAKFNHIFADTRLDAQNFWVQIKTDVTARRKMSAKVMPNL